MVGWDLSKGPGRLAPTIFALSRKKNWTVQQAVDVWVQDLNVLHINSVLQNFQFVSL